jgi:hypothetical protein
MVALGGGPENTWVADKATSYANNNTWWIGFNDRVTEDVWVWENGSPDSYTNWGGVEPNDWQGEDCGIMNTPVGDWADFPCEWDEPYICESQ